MTINCIKSKIQFKHLRVDFQIAKNNVAKRKFIQIFISVCIKICIFIIKFESTSIRENFLYYLIYLFISYNKIVDNFIYYTQMFGNVLKLKIILWRLYVISLNPFNYRKSESICFLLFEII